MIVQDYPCKFVVVGADDLKGFKNFFYNSFMHYYLRHQVRGLPPGLRKEIAENKADFICKHCKFLVGVDHDVPGIYYCYTAFYVLDDSLYLYMAYVKKDFRKFGFFRKSVELLRKKAYYYYYSMPLEANLLHDFTYKEAM